MSLESVSLVLFTLGFVPWHASRRIVRSRRKGQRYLVRYQVNAIFWRLTVDHPAHGSCAWRLTVPLVRRLADAVWAATRSLIDR